MRLAVGSAVTPPPGHLPPAPPTTHATFAGADSSVPERGAPYVETRLFFGTERPERPGGGPAVTDRRFMAFMRQ